MCLVLGLGGLARHRWEEAVLEREMRRDQAALGRGVAAVIAEGWSPDGGRDRALALLGRLNQGGGPVSLRWLDATAGEPASGAGPPEPAGADGGIVSHVPLRVGEAVVGVLEVSEPPVAGGALLRAGMAGNILAAGVLALLCGGVGLTLADAFVGRPVRRLAAWARRVDAGGRAAGLGGEDPAGLGLPAHDELGELSRTLRSIAVRLVTARAALEAERAARWEAEERLRSAERRSSFGAMAAGVAGELDAPLSTIARRARRVVADDVAGPAITDEALRIAELSERSVGVVRELLEYARQGSPAGVTDDLVPAVERAVTLLLPHARAAGVRLEHLRAESPVLAWFDRGQLHQVLTTLVWNAVQAMPDGGVVTLVVEVRQRPRLGERAPEHAWATVEVLHQGSTGCAGLGLSVASGIVRDHRGWIEVRHSPNGGGRLTAYLPAQEV